MLNIIFSILLLYTPTMKYLIIILFSSLFSKRKKHQILCGFIFNKKNYFLSEILSTRMPKHIPCEELCYYYRLSILLQLALETLQSSN